jgi:hypothetical protein
MDVCSWIALSVSEIILPDLIANLILSLAFQGRDFFPLSTFLFLFLSLSGAEDGTQGLVYFRQVLTIKLHCQLREPYFLEK